MLTSEACETWMRLHSEWVCAFELGTQQVVTKYQHLFWLVCHFLMRASQLYPDFLQGLRKSLCPDFPVLVVPWTQSYAVYRCQVWPVSFMGRPSLSPGSPSVLLCDLG